MNQEKMNAYTIMKAKLKKAFNAKFYYEAIFLEYAMIQDRIESILIHAKGPEAVEPGQKISRSINLIRSKQPFTETKIRKKVPIELLDEIMSWCNERNRFVHALAKAGVDDEKAKEVAIHGNEILKGISNSAKKVARSFDENK